ncbi:MAG: hypothetical protein J6S28_11560, partial [Clostridia bacterium]|nr:hypothetical protein [Clostridia bacterium]
MMRKTLKSFLLGLLCVSMLLGCFACKQNEQQEPDGTEQGTDAPTVEQVDRNKPQQGPFSNTTELHIEKQSVTETEKVVSEEYEFTADGGSMVFTVGEGRAKGDIVSLNANTVANFNIGVKFNENVVAKYEFKLLSSAPDEADYDTAYLGLRLTGTGSAPNHEGQRVWILMKDQKIGLRTGSWPSCTMVQCPVDFSKGVSLIVEDDPVSNVISICYSDNGTKTPLAKLVICDDKLEFYLEGSGAPDITEPLADPVPRTGYARIWTHHMEKAVKISNMKVSGQSTVSTTEPVDMLNSRDVFADTWVATDDVGRTMPVGGDTAAPSDKKVGIFYFMWHNATEQGQHPLYDHTAAYLEGGVDAVWDLVPQGPLGFAHYWAQPYFGYYNSDDEWVIRKHGYMLAEAGVDFIYVDATNGIIYERNLETLLRVWSEMRTEGYNVPQICFHCGNTESLAASSLNFLWNNYYSTGKYADMWFMWEGKPLIFFP